MKKAKQPLEAIKSIEEKMEEIEERVEQPVERQPSGVENQTGVLKLGERVTVGTLNADGVVTALGEFDAEVQIGSLRVRARQSDLVRKGREEESPKDVKKASSSQPTMLSTKSPGLELNLRGKLVDDGLDELERYLERAYSAGLLFVRIVHGKGTGKMRDAVRNALKESSYVASFEEPKDNEGGAGVTVANMAK
jgi:DNA mismatch repair protein MutS2